MRVIESFPTLPVESLFEALVVVRWVVSSPHFWLVSHRIGALRVAVSQS